MGHVRMVVDHQIGAGVDGAARPGERAGRRGRVVVAEVQADDDQLGPGGAQPGDVAHKVGLDQGGDAGMAGARILVDPHVPQKLALAVGEQADADAAGVDEDAAAGRGESAPAP